MDSHLKNFASDNYAGVHPRVLAAIQECAYQHAPAYGNDRYTAQAAELFKDHFGSESEAYFVFNGTGANVVALNSIVDSFHSIICPVTAHINQSECGAVEKMTGARIIPVDTFDGKLTPELSAPFINGFGDEHRSQPRLISISQVTEYGTIYTQQEIFALSELAHKNNMLLHVDGSRLCNAAVALSTNLREITTDVGVDVLSFGGTKNGMMYGEAVVFFNSELAKKAKFYRKQNTQLASKHRFIAAQFIAMLESGLWRENATHANEMAARLAIGIRGIHGVTNTKEVQSNAVFARLSLEAISELQKKFLFYVWDEAINEVRWMTSYETAASEVDEFVENIKFVPK